MPSLRVLFFCFFSHSIELLFDYSIVTYTLWTHLATDIGISSDLLSESPTRHALRIIPVSSGLGFLYADCLYLGTGHPVRHATCDMQKERHPRLFSLPKLDWKPVPVRGLSQRPKLRNVRRRAGMTADCCHITSMDFILRTSCNLNFSRRTFDEILENRKKNGA